MRPTVGELLAHGAPCDPRVALELLVDPVVLLLRDQVLGRAARRRRLPVDEQLAVEGTHHVADDIGPYASVSFATKASKHAFQSGCRREWAGRFSVMSRAPQMMRAASSSGVTTLFGQRI